MIERAAEAPLIEGTAGSSTSLGTTVVYRAQAGARFRAKGPTGKREELEAKSEERRAKSQGLRDSYDCGDARRRGGGADSTGD
jgi:hypothetical protein